MFQLKDFVSITASMINRARATQSKVTDFNVGSVARTLIEAPAIEIEELYQRMFAGIMDAIPVAIYRGFNFTLLQAAKARGIVTVTFGGPVAIPFTVPAGTVFLAPASGLRYLSAEAVQVSIGDTSATIIVDASEVGTAYNAPANAITTASGYTFPTGSVITSNAITSGTDGETDEERMSRFAAYIASISRGTVAAVEYGAASAKVVDASGVVVEQVSRVGSSEVPGRIDVFIYGNGTTASEALVAAAQKIVEGYWDAATQSYVEGYRPAGVDALVSPMITQAVDLGVTVELVTGYTLAPLLSAIITALQAAIDSVHAGRTLYVDDLRAAVLAVTGVRAVRLDATENLLCPANVVLVPGAITVVEGVA